MAKTTQLTNENTNRLIGSYVLGNNEISAKRTMKKDIMKLCVFVGDVPKNWTDEQIDKYLSRFSIVDQKS